MRSAARKMFLSASSGTKSEYDLLKIATDYVYKYLAVADEHAVVVEPETRKAGRGERKRKRRRACVAAG